MGYVHNTHMAKQVPLSDIISTVGTWTLAVASNLWSLNKTAADNTSVLCIPLEVPQNSEIGAGSIINSVVISYSVATDVLTDMTASAYKTTINAEGTAPTVAQVNSSATFGKTIDDHTVSVELGIEYPKENEMINLEVTIDATATAVVKITGVMINYTLRV